jgi:hypothetical protein
MAYSKFISALILGIFLISFTSALTISDGLWIDNGLQHITIIEGQSVDFEAGAYVTTHPQLTLNVEIYTPNIYGTRIHSFPTESSSNHGFYKTYTITPSIYIGPGDYEIVISSSDTDGSGDVDYYSLTLTVNAVEEEEDEEEDEDEDEEEEDTTAPIITLIGSNPQTIVQGTSYIELGATATDDVDGDLTSSIITDSTNVDTSTVGFYLVTYSVSDSSGNSATISRLVNVIEEDDEDDEDDEDEDEHEHHDDDNHNEHTHDNYPKEDEPELSFPQFNPKIAYLDPVVEKQTLSWFQKLINTISAFFKWIFRLE